MLLQAEQMHKMTYILFKMDEVVILSENGCNFVNFFLSLKTAKN